ncbi:MAG: ABC transporter substrate-binding protein [Deltaproteobacteria bacterium]|jgi:peptide/nickel transport system substrate-binding protein|nr:ABC transporter substrate-binding protein [Deltaproteobacteria bacterium]
MSPFPNLRLLGLFGVFSLLRLLRPLRLLFPPLAVLSILSAPPLFSDTLRLIYPEAPKSLDPHHFPPDPNAYPVVMNSYRRLFDLEAGSSNLESAASVARTYRVSDDGLMYTVILREDESFADGSPVNPEAVLFSFDRLMASEAGKAFFPYLRYLRIDGPYTLALILDRPWPPFAASLSLPQASIISPSLSGLPRNHLKDHTLGSGRYVLSSFEADKLVLSKREEAASSSSPDQVEFLYETDPAKRISLYREKDAKIALLEPPVAEAIPQGAELRRIPTWTTRYLAFNLERDYVKNPEAREALALVAEHSFSSMPLRSQGLLPRGFQGAPASPPAGDLRAITAEERAREILDRIGRPRGPLTLVYRPEEKNAYRDAVYLSERFQAAGVPVNAVPLKGSQGNGIAEKGDYDLYLGTRHPEIPSSEMWLGKFLDSRAGTLANPSRYKNPQADRQIDGFDASSTRPERENRVKTLAALAGRERPYVLLYQEELLFLADRTLSDVSPHPMFPLSWPLDKVNLNPFRKSVPEGPKPPPAEPGPEPVRDFDEPVAEFYE